MRECEKWAYKTSATVEKEKIRYRCERFTEWTIKPRNTRSETNMCRRNTAQLSLIQFSNIIPIERVNYDFRRYEVIKSRGTRKLPLRHPRSFEWRGARVRRESCPFCLLNTPSNLSPLMTFLARHRSRAQFRTRGILRKTWSSAVPIGRVPAAEDNYTRFTRTNRWLFMRFK